MQCARNGKVGCEFGFAREERWIFAAQHAATNHGAFAIDVLGHRHAGTPAAQCSTDFTIL